MHADSHVDPRSETHVPGCQPLALDAVLTHHWLVRRRGGEKVLAALRCILPRAPIYTLVHDPAGAGDGWGTVHTSWLQRVPGATRHYPKLLPFMPAAAQSVQLPACEMVVCSDAALAKAMRPDARSRVVCYCHSPMRYVWEPEISRTYQATLPAPLRPMWPALLRRLQRADLVGAQQVHQFVANSQHVARRIANAYRRESVVVYPPVSIPAEPPQRRRENYFLCVGHHVAYKRLDLAVEACRRLGRRLVVIGEGPAVRQLRHASAEQITLLGWQPDAVVAEHYARAAALLFPGEEDFGIVPVEAMGHGCPVIAFGAGGATETVIDGVTGVHFPQQSAESLAEAILRFDQHEFDPIVLHARASQFSQLEFLLKMRAVLNSVLERR